MIKTRPATLLPSQARLERMSEEDATSFCHQVLMSAAAKQAQAKQPASIDDKCTPLQHGLAACSRLVLGAPAHATLILAIASGAMAQACHDSSGSRGNGSGASAPGEFTVDMYRRWVKEWPAVQELLGLLLKGAGLLELQRVVEPGAGPSKPTYTIKPPTDTSSAAARSQDRPPWMPACPVLAEVGRPGQQPLLLKPLFAWMLSSCMTTGEAQISSSRACRLHHFQSLCTMAWQRVTAAVWSVYVCAPQQRSVGERASSLPTSCPFLLRDLCANTFAADSRHEWRCTFNSDRDGKSFNTLIARMGAFQGPSLLLVRDKAGHVFGGYAPAPWAKQGTFYGDASTFIFSLQPSTQVRRTISRPTAILLMTLALWQLRSVSL